MQKRFNDTGLCIPTKHFMVDISHKMEKIMALIENGDYFTMNRPRQFGKTTTYHFLYTFLLQQPEYVVIRLSFESMGQVMFSSEKSFVREFLGAIADILLIQNKQWSDWFLQKQQEIEALKSLGKTLSEFVFKEQKKVVLMIDEVDKFNNNDLFLQFLAMLRDNYLSRDSGIIPFLQSVILLGVHDIKNLKRKIRPEDAHSLNSPWNIATDFTVDMSFNATEIQTMLKQYCEETDISMNIPEIAEKIYYYTSGYPYLVSKMCKVIDEIILSKADRKHWTMEDIEESFRFLVNPAYTTTLFDDLAKNLNNNPDLYQLVSDIVINAEKRTFNIGNPVIAIAHTYGILVYENGSAVVHNRIFEKRVYDMMLSVQETKPLQPSFSYGQFESKNQLLLKEILLKFQEFMQENYSSKDISFLEREGRLLFLSFLKPILNGKGFDFKEPVVGDERRVDIVITYLNQKHILELKIWRGEEYHEKGLQQLSDYLDLHQLKEGFLLIYDFRKTKEYKIEDIKFQDKDIFAVWV
ncbi:MAG: AAA family ATPase [Cytophagales bacterium]|nr:MAG: AAA family ATPase [Cytophagales bacterium]